MYKSLDPFTWYGNREMEFTPVHFVISKTPLTNESKLWIINSLRGRYSIVFPQDERISNNWTFINESLGVPAFEDPKEAVLYELTWA